MKKVLIIEDDRDTLEMLGCIARESGVVIVLSSDVLPLKEIERINPDLIFLDHWVGTRLGGDLCLEIKLNEATKDIPVILISAINEINEIAFKNCADGALHKPFDVQEIQDIILAYTL